jgi:hypothetical protein
MREEREEPSMADVKLTDPKLIGATLAAAITRANAAAGDAKQPSPSDTDRGVGTYFETQDGISTEFDRRLSTVLHRD